MTFLLYRISLFIIKPLCAFILIQGSVNCLAWNNQEFSKWRNTDAAATQGRQQQHPLHHESYPNYRNPPRGRLKSNLKLDLREGSNSISLIEKLYNRKKLNLTSIESNFEILNRPIRQRTKWRDGVPSNSEGKPHLNFYNGNNQNGDLPEISQEEEDSPVGQKNSLPLSSWPFATYSREGSSLYRDRRAAIMTNRPPLESFSREGFRSPRTSQSNDGRAVPSTPSGSSNLEDPISSYRDPAGDFHRHRVFTPQLFHGRTKREITSTLNQEDADLPHHDHISIGLTIGDQNVLVDLQLNRDLLPGGYFEKEVSGDSETIRRPPPRDAEMCHYLGIIKDRPGSWAALSTCDGIRGMVFDGEELHYIEPTPPSRPQSASKSHYLLSHSDLIPRNLTCGYSGKPHPSRDLFNDENFTRLLRYRRDTGRETIRGPYNANELSRYVELVLVTDVTELDKYDKDEKRIFKRCKDIANIVNALYQPLNIFIALVGVEVWKDKDQVNISTDGDKTLTKFLNYRKYRLIPKHPNDNAQLLTGKVFDSGVVGKALKGPMCTYQYSGGVNMDHSESVGLVATTVAHEMGHNFGMEHDTEEDCECPNKRCIMSPSSGTKSPTHWSSCSHEYLAISFERSMDYCLRNKPTRLFNSPVCGNGFVEPGEQCDCGLPEYCSNPCCNATACMLYANATCATGQCCDLQSCRPKDAGMECRAVLHECDLPEFCSGDSEYCPDNFYKEDGYKCLNGQAHCYEGMCRTHENQCRLLWGPTGKNSHDKCYSLNEGGNPNGNCGFIWSTDTYIKCNHSDIKCGMMHCKHFNERLEFGMESVSKVSHRFIADKNGVIPCRVAQVDLGLDMVDPGLAPDGAKCGYNKMCVNQHCIEVASLRVTNCDCNGNGVCNNKGNCHCDVGFSYPDCVYPGLGGSKDSGPASNPNATNGFIIGLFIFFLGIVPLVVIFLLTYYSRGNLKLWWLQKGIPVTSRLSGKDSSGRAGSIAPGYCIEVVSKTSQDNASNKQTTDPCSPSPTSSQGSKSNSPLLNGYANGPAKPFSGSFFGKYEGFTISPIKAKPKQESTPPANLKSPQSILRSNVNLPKVDSQSKTPPIASPLSPSGESKAASAWKVKPNSLPINAWPPNNKGAKVDISEPSLQASTNPAVEAPSHPVNLRSAPPPPPQGSMSTEAPNRHSINRPKSVPDASTLFVQQKSASLECDSSSTTDSFKENKQSTVARIASFLTKKDKPDHVPETTIQVGQSNTLPRKAAKINRESLMQLEISHPMQLQATELPSNLLPVRTAPDPPMPNNIKPSDVKAAQILKVSPDKNASSKISWAPDVANSKVKVEDDKPDILRIGSVREQPVTTRPSIPKFGSMRAPRPKSLPPPTRPSQPPPRPPLPMIPGTPESDYFYDESFDEENTAVPLATSEEDPSSPQESIYATIDEDPPESSPSIEPTSNSNSAKKDKKSIFSLLYSKAKKKSEYSKDKKEPLYCNIDEDSNAEGSSSGSRSSPTSKSQRSSIDRTSSGSIECGLLSEIVSELANREPQYVNTLSKNKRSLSEEKPGSTKEKGNATQNKSLHSSPTKEAVPIIQLTERTLPPKENSSQSSKDNEACIASTKSSTPYLSSFAKPRGVFSYLRKSNSEDSSKPSSVSAPSPSAQSAKSSPQESETSALSLSSTKQTSLDKDSSVKVKQFPREKNVSASKSLGAVSAASKEPTSLKMSNTDTSDLKNKRDVEPVHKNSLKENILPASTAAASSVVNASSASKSPITNTIVPSASHSRPIFPPDKVISHNKSKYAQSTTAAKKSDGKPHSSSRPSGQNVSSSASKPLRVTSPPRLSSQAQSKNPTNTPSAQNSHVDKLEKTKAVIAPKPSNVKGPRRVSSAPRPVMKAKSLSSDKFDLDKNSSKENKKVATKGADQQAAKPLRAASAPLKSPTASRADVFASAAKGSSHVASLQQKFETEGKGSQQPNKPLSKLPHKTQDTSSSSKQK